MKGQASRTVVIGVGNPYRLDDGVGPAVIARLGTRPTPPGVVLAECDGEPTSLLDLWHGARVAFVVDAVRTNRPTPGRVHRLRLIPEEWAPDVPVPDVRAARAASSHGVDLHTAIALARAVDRTPAALVAYLVEVTRTDAGVGLSDAVRDAADVVAARIAAEWNATP